MTISRSSALVFQPESRYSDRQPVEQLGMAGRFALRAEVFLGLDQPDAEDLRPEAIDGHSGGQGVPRIDQPPRQPEPVLGLAVGEGRQRLRHARSDHVARVEEVTLAAGRASPDDGQAAARPSPDTFGIAGLRLLEGGDLVARLGFDSGVFERAGSAG